MRCLGRKIKKFRTPRREVYQVEKPSITFFTQGRSIESIKRASNFSASAKISQCGIKRNPNFL